ncbi:MAG: hypothetical protein WAW37_15025 [Syntrophobacteraceae bacterium]
MNRLRDRPRDSFRDRFREQRGAMRPGPGGPSREEFRALFRMCSDPRPPVREEALGLLLYPEGADLPGCHARLFERLARLGMRVGEIPSELLQALFELIGSSGRLPQDPEFSRFFHAAVARIPRKLLPWLLRKRYPIGPFLDSLGERLLRTGARAAPVQQSQVLCSLEGLSRTGARAAGFRIRWRIFRNLLAAQSMRPLPDPSLEITVADLGRLFGSPPRAGRAKSAWRRTAKHLAARPASTPPPAPPSFSRLYWGGAGNRTLAFWEQLADAQAIELDEIRRLAERVSADTGRVVLSWHNASLAAAGGWGFEDFSTRFASPRLYREFARSVWQAADEIRENFDGDAVSGLFEMRARRIFAPKAAQALEHARSLRELGPDFKARWREMSRKAAPLLDPYQIEAIESGGKTEWSGALAPHQQVSLDRVLAWCGHAKDSNNSENSKKTWAEGLALYFALAVRGREALDSGAASSFVLPWIDKFFISSKRRADQGYIEGLFRLVSSHIEAPLALFWEDTAHARLPSFGLALEELAGRGLPFRGIGIFDPQGSKRSDAAEIIRREYPKNLLFALRPVSDSHFAGTFRRIFDPPAPGFLRDYDSSWKDNLVFIYAGTRVFPLLSAQTEMESVSPWVSDGRARHPFGAWFRQRLRGRVLGARGGPPDPLAQTFSAWANLL